MDRRGNERAGRYPKEIEYNCDIMNNNLKGIFLAAFGGMCWGLSGSVGQYLFTQQGMDSRWLVPIRLGCAGVLLIIYCFFKYGRKTLEPWQTKKNARDLIVYGLLGISCCQFLYFLTIQLSTAGAATILQDLSPIFILIATCMIEKRSRRHWKSELSSWL
jgi:drug/metabolite transporter (DMT)-like permease